MSRKTPYANHLAHSVKRLYHLMGQYFNDVLRPYGVAQSQWYILYYISQSAGATQRTLQNILQVESATLTGAINAMEKKGWVMRRQNAADRRVKELYLTPAGQALWESLPDPILAVRKRMLQDISREEEGLARKVLEKAIRNFER